MATKSRDISLSTYSILSDRCKKKAIDNFCESLFSEPSLCELKVQKSQVDKEIKLLETKYKVESVNLPIFLENNCRMKYEHDMCEWQNLLDLRNDLSKSIREASADSFR